MSNHPQGEFSKNMVVDALTVEIAEVNFPDPQPVVLKSNPVTLASQLRVTTVPYGYDIVLGNIADKTPIFKTGFQATVNNVEVDLWNVVGKYVFPTGAMGMEVTSTSTSDTALGSGARTVKIWYLTTAFAEKTETITLNGTGVVPTVATDLFRINAFRVLTAGTGDSAAGTISLRHIDNTPIYSQIAPGNTRGRNSIYTVPVDKTLYITHITYSVGNATGGRYARFTLRATYDDKAGAASSVFYPYHEIGIQDGAFSMSFEFPIKLPAGTDVKISVISDAGNADAICTGAYRGWQE